MSVPAAIVNKVCLSCLSGLPTIGYAAQQIACGQAEVVIAGGTESMSNAPHLVPRARRGIRYGSAVFLDAMDSDALTCGFGGMSMGAATATYQARLGVSREAQDAFTAESHARAAAAIRDGRLAGEITPVTIPGRKGELTMDEDEILRPGTTAG